MGKKEKGKSKYRQGIKICPENQADLKKSQIELKEVKKIELWKLKKNQKTVQVAA